jgi:hypothetical protein
LRRCDTTPPPIKKKETKTMEIIRAKEKVILTAGEYAIINKAYKIMDDICDECEVDDGEGLLRYATNAKDELEYFLNDGKNDFYEVEETTCSTVTVRLFVN